MKSCRSFPFTRRNRKGARQVHILCFLIPSLTGVSVFVLLPFLDMVRRSFTTAMGGRFCGLDNYRTVFFNEAFRRAVKNTLGFAGVSIPLLMTVSLLLALSISKSPRLQALKSAWLFPLAIPTATVVLVWKMIFSGGGLLNEGLGAWGIHGIDWMGSNAAFAVLVMSYLWKNLGYTVVLWLAGILAVPENIMEAARVDGASGWQSLRYILLPNLKPTFYVITVLSFLNSFKVFREAYLVAGAYPQQSIYQLQHLFNNWFTNLELDKMSAAAVCVALVLGAAVFGLQRLWDDAVC